MPSSEVSEQMSSTLSPQTADNAREIGVDVIRQRLDAFRSSTDFNDLWPDVNEGLRHAAHRKIFAVTRCVLNDTTEDRHLPAGDEGEIRALGIAGYASGMGPLLGYWIETGAITADVDLLIRPSERSAAEKALESLGFLETASSRGQASWSPPGSTCA